MSTAGRGLALALPIAAALASPAAEAQTSFRCRNDLVNVGDSQASALLKCGEPVVKGTFCRPLPATRTEPAPQGGTTVVIPTCENIDEWTYNPGYGQFMTTLQFAGGRLVGIQYGDRAR